MTVVKPDDLKQEEGLNGAKSDADELANGDNISRETFIRIWEQLPNLKRAELIDGSVFLPPPHDCKHANILLGVSEWISAYKRATPRSLAGANGTWFMLKSAPQPDVALWLSPEYGGQSIDDGRYPEGAPELAFEIAPSSVAYELHQKLKLYCDAGVQEYLVIVLRKPEIRWHRRVDSKYEMMTPTDEGIFHSLVFPGLWLNGAALLRDDMNGVMATLQEGLRSPEHAEFVARLHANKEN